jgi:MerR family mercuric resistance operon transcriptional regulator
VTYRGKRFVEAHLDNLTIGQVATQAGVHKETIRYYQSLGLVAEPPRPPGSVRRYERATVARLNFIKRAQELGFTLAEVRKLLLLEDGQDCARTRSLAEDKLATIKERIADLRRMQRLLEELIDECRRGRRPRSCPIISTLSGR